MYTIIDTEEKYRLISKLGVFIDKHRILISRIDTFFCISYSFLNYFFLIIYICSINFLVQNDIEIVALKFLIGY